jgi:hypothetical protein
MRKEIAERMRKEETTKNTSREKGSHVALK